MYDKALIISRYHDDLSNPIYNAYVRGIKSQCKMIHFVDYFDQIGALGKQGFEELIYTILNKEKINLIFFIFVSGDAIIDPYFIQNIARNRFIAMVFWDIEQFFEQIDRYYAQLADLVILPANYEYIYKLNTLGINAICPFSLFDNTKYKQKENTKQTIDVSFIGEVTKGSRKEYIQYLIDNGIKIETYGVGTKNGKISFNKVIDIFNSSKINLSFTGTYDNSVYTYCSNINNRIQQNKGKPIEIALCGGFVLTEYVNGIEKVFPEQSIDTFKTKEELLKKIIFYLENNNLRESMKIKSYKYAAKNYDSIVAFEKIFEKINEIKPKNEKQLILDDIFIKIHNNFHLFYAIAFISQKRIKLALQEILYTLKHPLFIFKDLKKHLQYYVPYFIIKQKFKKDINKLIKRLKNKRVVIYAAGVHTTDLLYFEPKLNKLNIVAITDSKTSLQNGKFLGKKLIKPSEIASYGDTVIISSFCFRNEIEKYLNSLNLKNVEIINLYSNQITKNNVSIIHSYSNQITKNNVSIKRYQRTDPYQIYRDTLKLK